MHGMVDLLEWDGWQGITGIIAVIALVIAALALVDSLGDVHSNVGKSWALHIERKDTKDGRLVDFEFRVAGPASLYEVGIADSDTVFPNHELPMEPVLTAASRPLCAEFIVRPSPEHEPPHVVVTWATVRYGRPRTHHLRVSGFLKGEKLQALQARKRRFSKKLRWKPVTPHTATEV